MPYSNVPTEGAVNLLKTIKRQMYGRAGFDLLRLWVLSGELAAPKAYKRLNPCNSSITG